MGYIYCEKTRWGRFYYQESPGFRERLPGSYSSLTRTRESAFVFPSKAEAWAHCRERRRRHPGWGPRTWVVVKVTP